MNPFLDKLQPYPFQKLGELFSDIAPDASGKLPIKLSIGEPKGETPALIRDAVAQNLAGLANYPLTKGQDLLRSTIADWLVRRFKLPKNTVNAATQVLPVNGTREALFAFAQAVVDPSINAKVLMPNPFYQIYEGAAFLAGAEPVFINCTQESGFIPDFDQVAEADWQGCQLLYLCSPGNPTGAVIAQEQLIKLINLAEKYDFIIASDECYSEIYQDENQPPPGLLEAAVACGNSDFNRCVVFHSLSKRSNAPGLRSGFVAGDANVLARFLLYRTYHGSAMPAPTQAGSIAAWSDESHVIVSRQGYRQRFAAVAKILSPVLDLRVPEASFYLWPKVPISDESFAYRLQAEQNVTVLPGSYLSREHNGINPGSGYIRMALVAELDECISAAERIRDLLVSL